jgi:hypothetical protein
MLEIEFVTALILTEIVSDPRTPLEILDIMDESEIQVTHSEAVFAKFTILRLLPRGDHDFPKTLTKIDPEVGAFTGEVDDKIAPL